MGELEDAIAVQTERQVEHWTEAAARLDLEELASHEAWGRLESYLGVAIRRHLRATLDRLAADARVLIALDRDAGSPTARREVRRRLLGFRSQYLRTETTLEFFADAINVRTNPHVGALLRACDTLAHRSMAQLLDQLDRQPGRAGMTAPVALTYLDKGLGASILKAGLRLWDGGEACPVAVIKVTRHNLLRPTALIHEAGHQVAHICNWNGELAAALTRGLERDGAPGPLARIWASWASEIAADAFAFAHTGFAAVAALHDVLAGDEPSVFRYLPGDPHPVSYLRVLLGVQMCRYFFGRGPWDGLALAWTHLHSLDGAPAESRAIVADSMGLLDAVVRLTLDTPAAAFGGKPLRAMIAPERVSPTALTELATRIGPALFTSAHWLWAEPLRILGLTGLRLAQTPKQMTANLDLQQQAMLRLGGALQAA